MVALSRNRIAQLIVLFAGPALLYGLVWTMNALAGTAGGPGCGIWGVWLYAAERNGTLEAVHDTIPFLGHLQPPASRCQSVPFSADVTNQTLAITAGFAVSIYLLFNLRLRFLSEQLAETGLLTPESLARSGLGADLARPVRRLSRPRRWALNGVLAVGGLVLSALMYNWTYSRGPIFDDLARSYAGRGSQGVTAASLRDAWWANHHHYPMHTAMGVAVGSIGLLFAAKQAIVFANVTLLTWRVRKLSDRRPIEFVPKWFDGNYGWRPAAGLVSLGYASALTFLASFAAALYMLRTKEPGLFQVLLVILAIIATLGVVANAGFLGNLVWTIRSLFDASLAQERARLRERLADGLPDRQYHLSVAIQLAETRNYPLRGRTLRILAAVPAAFAVYQFFDQVTRAFGVVL